MSWNDPCSNCGEPRYACECGDWNGYKARRAEEEKRKASYTNHSGGAKGADMMWDRIGKKYGFNNHCHWRPSDLENLPEDVLKRMNHDVEAAAEVLKRPKQFKGIELVQRNWLQVRYADGIYAVSYIIAPGEVDFKGFKNETGKEIVSGGTGWAVEMAIQKQKPVYVFDMTTSCWYIWNSEYGRFFETLTPTLTQNYAGIGSRKLTPQGILAIENVYKITSNEK